MVMLTSRGEVIGINTAIASNSGGSEGIGFAIPIKMFMNVAGQLIDKGQVHRAFLGVTLELAFDAAMAKQKGLPRPMGALVKDITPDSPAAKAELRSGDVILTIDKVPVVDDNHLVNLISFSDVGKNVEIIVFRDGKEIAAKTKLANQTDFSP